MGAATKWKLKTGERPSKIKAKLAAEEKRKNQPERVFKWEIQTEHSLLKETWEKWGHLTWWLAHRFAKVFGCSVREIIGTCFIRMNHCLHTWDESKGSFSTYYMRHSFSYIQVRFFRHESEYREINWLERNSTEQDRKVTNENFAFHENEFYLYRIPDRDETWSDRLIQCFENMEECKKFLFKELDQRSRDIIEMRFQMGLSGSEVGDCYNISRERVRQIEDKAMQKIRKRVKQLEDFADLFTWDGDIQTNEKEKDNGQQS